jgi:chemotaxis protein MotB
MYFKIFMMLVISFSISACVSSGKYKMMTAERDALKISLDSSANINRNMQAEILSRQKEISRLRNELSELNKTYNNLKENATSGALELITRLEGLQKDIEEREARIIEIRQKLEAREKAVEELRNKLHSALLGFTDRGLTIHIKDGKVYVSLDNQLLFQTGRTDIDNRGKEALLELANVLNEQEDINILVEGHTDTQPIRSGGRFADNWDLSVMRATEVVRYLTTTGSVDPRRIVASGRSEYFPINPDDSVEAKAQNRRTEIILTPKLEQLFDIIGD